MLLDEQSDQLFKWVSQYDTQAALQYVACQLTLRIDNKINNLQHKY